MISGTTVSIGDIKLSDIKDELINGKNGKGKSLDPYKFVSLSNEEKDAYVAEAGAD